MSPSLGLVGDYFRSRDLEEIAVVLASLAASIYMGVGLMTPDAGRSVTPEAGRQSVVVLTGDGQAERLIADSLGDVVLTLPRPPDSDSLVAEVRLLQPTRIVILGGGDVVSEALATALAKATTARVSRYAGEDRYQTAAQAALATFRGPVPELRIAASDASLDTRPRDAATTDGIPVLLVARGNVPAATTRALQSLRPGSITIVDPAGAVSDAVTQQLRGHTTGDVTRTPAT